MSVFRITTLFLLFSFTTGLNTSATETGVESQPATIREILQNEKNQKHKENLFFQINYIDRVYGNLFEKIQSGGKITVFMDPAHGILPDGRWQGGRATGRQSVTGLPEEYYSIILSRKLYRKLERNPFIKVVSTEDYMKVLQGKSDRYMRINFNETVKRAFEGEAFIIVSQHLNNVSTIHKASGMINMTGIHITYDSHERPVLRNIQGEYSGFLTLYNRYDAGGFSKKYAENLKTGLISQGLTPNSWGQGVVPDNRFIYFVDFPVSVMYESGFISNRREESLLRKPEYQKAIVNSQYISLLQTIKESFGVDLSGRRPRRIKTQDDSILLNMKLSMAAVYYIRNLESEKAVKTIAALEKANPDPEDEVLYFSKIKERLETFEKNLVAGRNTSNNNSARSHFVEAGKAIQGSSVFSAYRSRYSGELYPSAERTEKTEPEKIDFFPETAVRASRDQPVILTVEKDQTLKEAVFRALRPDSDTLNILTENISKAMSSENKLKCDGYPYKGIYIVTLNRNITVSDIKKVDSVLLNPEEYQSQLYMKNSYFAERKKQRGL